MEEQTDICRRKGWHCSLDKNRAKHIVDKPPKVPENAKLQDQRSRS